MTTSPAPYAHGGFPTLLGTLEQKGWGENPPHRRAAVCLCVVFPLSLHSLPLYHLPLLHPSTSYPKVCSGRKGGGLLPQTERERERETDRQRETHTAGTRNSRFEVNWDMMFIRDPSEFLRCSWDIRSDAVTFSRLLLSVCSGPFSDFDKRSSLGSQRF